MKKILSLVLTLAMVLSMFSFSFAVSAETTMPEGAIAIDSVAGLKAMEAGKYYYLTKDLTIGSAGTVAEGFVYSDAGPSADADWATKPVEESMIVIPAGATLDGNGHTLYYGNYVTNPARYNESGFYTNSLAWNHAMIGFGKGATVTVKNLNIGDSSLPVYLGKGTAYGVFDNVLTADYDLAFDNVHVTAQRDGRGLSSKDVGVWFFAASGNITLNNCSTNGSMISAGWACGGFIWSSWTADLTLTMTNCVNNAQLAGSTLAGFLVTTKADYTNTLSFVNCKNIGVEGATFSGSAGVGGIVWNPGGAKTSVYLDNCVNFVNIYLGDTIGGGLVGRVQGSAMKSLIIKNSMNFGNVSSNVAKASSNYGMGGVAGHIGAVNFLVENCANYGDVAGHSNMGGVIGRVDGSANGAVVRGCANFGLITHQATTGTAANQVAGGIIGQNNAIGLLIDNCTNYANINPNKISYGAGILGGGYNGSATVTMNSCENYGTIGSVTGAKQSAGLIGYVYSGTSTWNINNCANYGAVLSYQWSGGVICSTYWSGLKINIKNTANYGEVIGEHGVSGFIGQLYTHADMVVNIENCLNTGKVAPRANTSGEGLGGFIGRIDTTSPSVTIKNSVNTGKIYGSAKNSADYGAFGDTIGQFIGAYTVTNGVAGAYESDAAVGGFFNFAKNPTLTNCYAYGEVIIANGAKSLTGWKYYADPKVASTVAATVPNGGAYGINVEVAAGSTVYYLKDTTPAKAAETATKVLGVEMIAGASDENAVVIATPEIRGLQQSLDETSIRFVAGISSSNFDSIGYIYSVSVNGVEKVTDAKETSDYVMLEVNATGTDGTIKAVTASSMSVKYLTAITFNGIPKEGTVEITVAPTATVGDTTYVGTTYLITIVDGVYTTSVEVEAATKVVAGGDLVVSSEDTGIVIDYAA